jgi:hypothetical protein
MKALATLAIAIVTISLGSFVLAEGVTLVTERNAQIQSILDEAGK